jgi:hypothetical protein
MTHRIITRPEWGAAHANGLHDRTPADLEVWLHHSVTVAPDLVAPFDDDYAAVRQIDRIGQNRFRSGIPYTFAITPAGLVFEGHSIGRVGAHTQGHNTRGAGIVLVGNYDTAAPPRPMLDALVWLLRHGVTRGWWKRPALNGGHRDTKATACPGRHAYPLISQVNAEAAGPAPSPAPSPSPAPAPSGPRLDVDGIRGPATIRAWQAAMGTPVDGRISRPSQLMIAWQRHLAARGLYSGAIDGIEGPQTIRGTQRYLGTPVDGRISRPSQMVIALQVRLNAGTLL